MNTNLRAGSLSRSGFAILLVGCGLAACTTQAAKKTDGGGGSTGVGGSSGSGGGAGGGSGGGSGTTAACGTGTLAPTPGVLCPLPDPANPMITDFTYDATDAAGTDQVRFGTFGTTLSGGEFAYVATGDVSGSDWHISGTVGDFAGFALYFDVVNGCNMVDASAYAGITFTIWGTLNAGALPATITMGVGILDDSVAPSWLASVDAGIAMPSPGSCIPTMGNGQYYHPGCGDPTNAFSVTGTQASPQTVSIRWTDFTGGTCKPNVLPNEILSIYWQLPWAAGATPYMPDLHIDNLAFIPK